MPNIRDNLPSFPWVMRAMGDSTMLVTVNDGAKVVLCARGSQLMQRDANGILVPFDGDGPLGNYIEDACNQHWMMLDLLASAVAMWDSFRNDPTIYDGSPEPDYILQARGMLKGVPLYEHDCFVMRGVSENRLGDDILGEDVDLYVAPMFTGGGCDHSQWGLCESMNDAAFIKAVNELLGTTYVVKE